MESTFFGDDHEPPLYRLALSALSTAIQKFCFTHETELIILLVDSFSTCFPLSAKPADGLRVEAHRENVHQHAKAAARARHGDECVGDCRRCHR